MHLDVTPAGLTSNSYVTVEEATDLLAGRRETAPWFRIGLGDPFLPPAGGRQAQVLIWATRLLDEQINWFGHPLTRTQALAWPMTGQIDQYGRIVDQHTIPLVVRRATAFYGLALLRDDAEESLLPPLIAPGTRGASAVPWSTRAERRPVPAWQVIPAEIRHMLRFYGQCTGSAMVPLRRC